MATCKDIVWDTDDVTGWDFYDAYQSLSFLEEGYKIVVPKQLHPWCLHDDNQILNLSNYDFYRKRFLIRYAHCLGKSWQDIQKANR